MILISGKAGSGKDTAAKLMQDYFEHRGTKFKRVMIMHYADMLKFVCRQYFKWDGNKDERGRALLQFIGTDVVRNADNNFWVRWLYELAHILFSQEDFVIVADTRFPNEINYMKDRLGMDNVFHIRIERPGNTRNMTDVQLAHSSETALEDVRPDYTIENTGTLVDLDHKIEDALRELNLIDPDEQQTWRFISQDE